jgi:ABC-type amino acid transport substrate-binding protein
MQIRTRRKVLVVALAAIMALSLALMGCGKIGSGSSSSDGTNNAPATTDTASTAADGSTTDAAPANTSTKFKILDEPLSTEHYGVAFKLGDTQLRDAVEYTLVQMYNDGTVQKIADKYADQGLSYKYFVLKSTDLTSAPQMPAGFTLTVGFDEDFPPYGYVGDDGQYTGFDLDLAAEVASRNGWNIVDQPINWDSKDLELNSGNINCIWNGFTIEGRENAYTWTDPYMDNEQVVVVRQDSGINTLQDLAGKAVMAQADSSALSALTDDLPDLTATFKGGTVQTIPDYNTGFMELEQGSIDALAVDLPVANYQLANRG